jgi:hypothetical protein
LGTTNSCVAFWDKSRSRAKVIRIGKDRKDTMPSVAYLTEQAGRLEVQSVGYAAIDALSHCKEGGVSGSDKRKKRPRNKTKGEEVITPPGLLVDNVKRILGRSFEDPVVQQWRTRVPYHIQRQRNLSSSAPDGVAIALAVRDRASNSKAGKNGRGSNNNSTASTSSLGSLTWLWRRARADEQHDKDSSSSSSNSSNTDEVLDESEDIDAVANGSCVVPEVVSAALLEGLKVRTRLNAFVLR